MSDSPSVQPLVIANKVQPGATEISKGDFEASIERTIDFMIPYDQKAAVNAAKLGQTFADANRSSKAGTTMREIATAVLGAVEEGAQEEAHRPRLGDERVVHVRAERHPLRAEDERTAALEGRWVDLRDSVLESVAFDDECEIAKAGPLRLVEDAETDVHGDVAGQRLVVWEAGFDVQMSRCLCFTRKPPTLTGEVGTRLPVETAVRLVGGSTHAGVVGSRSERSFVSVAHAGGHKKGRYRGQSNEEEQPFHKAVPVSPYEPGFASTSK